MLDLSRQAIGSHILLFADFVFDLTILGFNQDGQALVALKTGHPDFRRYDRATLIGSIRLELGVTTVSNSYPNQVVRGGRVQFLMPDRYVIQTLDLTGCTIMGADGSWEYEVF